MMSIWSWMSVFFLGPFQRTSALTSFPAASAPALTVCQNWCVVPFGTTAILSRSLARFVAAGVGAAGLDGVGVGPALSWLVSRTQPPAASPARARIHRARVFIG